MEVISDKVCIYDACNELPKGKGTWRRRDPAGIDRIVFHKSGADGPPGLRGAIGSARYQVEQRGWPGMAYTYWIPRAPDTVDGRFMVYRCNPDNLRTYHTGGTMNGRGVGVGVQGRYDGEWDLVDGEPTIDREPTATQWECIMAITPYLMKRHGIGPEGLTGHWEHGKPVCPGDAIRKWILSQRQRASSDGVLTVRQRQEFLVSQGYDIVVDGIWGYQSRAALESFQRVQNLAADGVWGYRTAKVVAAIRSKT